VAERKLGELEEVEWHQVLNSNLYASMFVWKDKKLLHFEILETIQTILNHRVLKKWRHKSLVKHLCELKDGPCILTHQPV
jgi:hypothetical protein